MALPSHKGWGYRAEMKHFVELKLRTSCEPTHALTYITQLSKTGKCTIVNAQYVLLSFIYKRKKVPAHTLVEVKDMLFSYEVILYYGG